MKHSIMFARFIDFFVHKRNVFRVHLNFNLKFYNRRVLVLCRKKVACLVSPGKNPGILLTYYPQRRRDENEQTQTY